MYKLIGTFPLTVFLDHRHTKRHNNRPEKWTLVTNNDPWFALKSAVLTHVLTHVPRTTIPKAAVNQTRVRQIRVRQILVSHILMLRLAVIRSVSGARPCITAITAIKGAAQEVHSAIIAATIDIMTELTGTIVGAFQPKEELIQTQRSIPNHTGRHPTVVRPLIEIMDATNLMGTAPDMYHRGTPALQNRGPGSKAVDTCTLHRDTNDTNLIGEVTGIDQAAGMDQVTGMDQVASIGQIRSRGSGSGSPGRCDRS